MKPARHLVHGIVLLFLIFIAAASAAQAQNSSISGNVFDAQTRQPVSDLYVELLDRMGFTLARTRVRGAGHFVFSGLRAGDYQVKVLPLGTNYQEMVQDVRLFSVPLGNGRYSSDMAYVDIYLKLDPRKINVGSPGRASVVFAQEVPDEARDLYKKGVRQLEDKKEEGLDSLKKAIEIFPTYYDALDRLGDEYVRRKQYREAATYLVKAVEVNKRSYSSFYTLGIAAYNLKNWQTAIEALREATAINPQSINAQIFYGMVLRIDGQFEKAEKALLQAKSLAEKTSPVAEIHWQIALLYEKTGRYKEAADELERYLKIDSRAQNAEQVKKLIAELRAKAK
ncbi:MAG: tetratricopeptide repeat protein [Acidobacteriota bacterium]|nr:tetratricopeptide repeat protein [Acidobacteriota bacterium]